MEKVRLQIFQPVELPHNILGVGKLYYDRRYMKEIPRLDVGDPVRVAPPEKLEHELKHGSLQL